MPDTFYRRNLPHIHPDGHPLFITLRLADSLPLEIIHELKVKSERELQSNLNQSSNDLYETKKKYFVHFDNWLDRCASGPHWLADEKVACIVSHKICEMNNLRYKLIAYCIMSNHVHVLIENCVAPLTNDRRKSANYPVAETLRLLKGNTARYGNQALERTGRFWHHESYDHFVRNEEELTKTIQYILNNPVKAGLVKEWKDWKYSYVDPEFGEW